jgi:hypothetical protein
MHVRIVVQYTLFATSKNDQTNQTSRDNRYNQKPFSVAQLALVAFDVLLLLHFGH